MCKGVATSISFHLSLHSVLPVFFVLYPIESSLPFFVPSIYDLLKLILRLSIYRSLVRITPYLSVPSSWKYSFITNLDTYKSTFPFSILISGVYIVYNGSPLRIYLLLRLPINLEALFIVVKSLATTLSVFISPVFYLSFGLFYSKDS